MQYLCTNSECRGKKEPTAHALHGCHKKESWISLCHDRASAYPLPQATAISRACVLDEEINTLFFHSSIKNSRNKTHIQIIMQKQNQHPHQKQDGEGGREGDLKQLDEREQVSSSIAMFDGWWQNEENDISLRRRIMFNMYKLLITEFQKNDKYSDIWKRKLPLLVRRLESIHYHESPSKKVYMDVICPKKLKKKLRLLATAMYKEENEELAEKTVAWLSSLNVV